MKVFVIGLVLLFGTIGIIGWLKNRPAPKAAEAVQEISLGTSQAPVPIQTASLQADEPEIDRLDQLFALDSTELPIVETISFTSRVPWLKDRPAWIADYASHYQTSRHFIARCLNKKADYFTQKVHPGDRFNVFKEGKDLKFHLVVDLSKARMWFYYIDGKDKVLLKTYRVGLGKKEAHRTSGFLTPIGKYSLGEKIAIYKPGVTGFFQDEKVEMIRIFGTRWLPFEKEIEGCSEAAKGLGIHGLPWVSAADGQLVEDRSKLGAYDSDGCIRMAAHDIEEIFAIVITKPTTIEIVKEYHP
ncbi:MAG: L,D-transpeptidase [Verrucomicrobia bacterium]|nr:L,D-transpeptidase [Verrucomicrobiota bacterium]MDE3047092.1 L,D-transpeptidase [Verrucomicrobiota bacterium]